MIQAMFDENARKYRVRIDGSKEDIIKDLLAILDEIYQKKILDEGELKSCVNAIVIDNEEMVKEIVNRMPMIMLAAAMGDKKAQELADKFMNIIKKDDNE